MKIRLIITGLLFSGIFFCGLISGPGTPVAFKDGDIIFQSSRSGQSLAVQIATGSKYSHCGIIFYIDGKCKVLEAVQPVRYTAFSEWIKMGDDKKYVVKRLKDADSLLSPPMIKKMQMIGNKYKGKDYDLTFEWSDERIYCSELVWKIYKQAVGREIGRLQKLKDFNLTHPEVKKILKERYGDNIPYQETVISPQAIFECKDLDLILSK